MVYSAVLTDALWFTACPRPIISSLTGTCADSIQYVTIVTSIGGLCTNSGWGFIWLVAHCAIPNVQQRTVT